MALSGTFIEAFSDPDSIHRQRDAIMHTARESARSVNAHVPSIYSLRADMPIIMCTGFSELVDADNVKVAGIRAFVMRPLTKREIAKTIRKVLDE
jgi:AmiR/NasT family two-component response regulator